MLAMVLHSLMTAVFVISGLIVTAMQLITLLLWPFSRKYYRLANSSLVQLHWTRKTAILRSIETDRRLNAELLWLVEHYAGFKLTIYMDEEDMKLAQSESSVCLSNHISDIDWLLGWWIADKFKVLGVRWEGKRF
jgi:lysophosphatidic acid acyltransferase/lysophosphatidylinositol acyltransferase